MSAIPRHSPSIILPPEQGETSPNLQSSPIDPYLTSAQNGLSPVDFRLDQFTLIIVSASNLPSILHSTATFNFLFPFAQPGWIDLCPIILTQQHRLCRSLSLSDHPFAGPENTLLQQWCHQYHLCVGAAPGHQSPSNHLAPSRLNQAILLKVLRQQQTPPSSGSAGSSLCDTGGSHPCYSVNYTSIMCVCRCERFGQMY